MTQPQRQQPDPQPPPANREVRVRLSDQAQGRSEVDGDILTIEIGLHTLHEDCLRAEVTVRNFLQTKSARG